MAQTTTAISQAVGVSEVSTDGSSWTSLGPCLISTNFSGGDQHVGETNTQDGAAPVTTRANKHGAITADVTALYTPTAAQAWKLIRTAWDSSDKGIYFRYSAQGNTTGHLLHTATNDAGSAHKCSILNCLPPSSDANSGDPSRFTFSLQIPKFTESTVA